MPPQGEPRSSGRVDRSIDPAPDALQYIVNETAIKSDHVQIDSQLYNAHKLAAFHPGWPLFVSAFAGSDASEAFMSYHRRKFPHAKMSQYLEQNATAAKAEGVDADYIDLCNELEKILPRNKSFAPWHYYVKIFAIMAATVGLEVYMHLSADYNWKNCAFMGFLMALVGLNIQHDANHGAISRNPWVNRFLGMTQNWIGGSAVDWIHQHVVQHHVNCNHVDHDPDILGSSLLRVNPTKPLLGHQWLQHIYVFGLLCLFGFSVVTSSLIHLIKGQHLKHMSQLLKGHRVFDSLLCLFFFSRWAVLPVYQTGKLSTLTGIIPMYMVGGFYLSFFFIISHNFVGAKVFRGNEVGSKYQSFLFKQAASSSNVGGAFLCFLNGGLNYQIEHHLFPRVQHSHYPTIAPFVRAYCSKKGIPYVHFPSVMDNVKSTVSHLCYMGNELDPCPINE